MCFGFTASLVLWYYQLLVSTWPESSTSVICLIIYQTRVPNFSYILKHISQLWLSTQPESQFETLRNTSTLTGIPRRQGKDTCSLARDTNATRTPQTLSRHQESRTMIERRVEAWSLRGPGEGVERKARASQLFQLSIGHRRKLYVAFPCVTRHAGYNRITLLLRHQEGHYMQPGARTRSERNRL